MYPLNRRKRFSGYIKVRNIKLSGRENVEAPGVKGAIILNSP
jgi:hypothetical protein